jgi:hypothetical protein
MIGQAIGLSSGASTAASSAASVAELAGLYADGGKIVGPGGPRDDRMIVGVSNGEYIVNARATAKYGPLLELINTDRVPRFANGGYVSGAAPATLGGPAAHGGFPSLTYAPVVNAQGADKAGLQAVQQQLADQWDEFRTYVKNAPRQMYGIAAGVKSDPTIRSR